VTEKYQEKFKPLGANFFLSVVTKDIDSFTKNVTKLLEIISEDIELLRIILMDEYLVGYFKNFEQIYEREIIKYLKIKNASSKLIIRYVMSGTGGILAEWIIKDATSIEVTANIISRLIFDNIMLYIKENKK
jgi:hypothetical protein